MGATCYLLCWAATLLSILSMTASTSSVLGRSGYAASKSPSRKDAKCIASQEDLLQAYISKEHHHVVQANQTIFKFSQEYMLKYTQFAIYYRLLPPHLDGNVNVTINTCCNPVTEKNCYVVITSQKSIFVYFPPQLVYTVATIFTPITPPNLRSNYLYSKKHYGVEKGCWTPPTFCDDADVSTMVTDFSLTLLSYHLKDWVEDVPIPNIFRVPPKWFLFTTRNYPPLLIHMLFVSMCLLSFPVILRMVQKKIREKHRRKAFSGLPISQALYGAVCLSSWAFFVYLYETLIYTLNRYRNHLLSDGMPELFMPFVTVGYYLLIPLGGIFFLELLFMMWYISQKVLKANVQFTTRSRSRLLCCMKKAETMGLSGIVLFLQILTGYSIYFFTLLVASPSKAVAVVCHSVVLVALATLLIALLIIPFTTACRRCPRGSCKLALSVLVALMAFIFNILLNMTVLDNTTASFDTGRIASSLASSALLAIAGYSIRLLLIRQVSQERELVSQYDEIKD